MTSSNFFKIAPKDAFENFNFEYFDRLFVENYLTEFIGEPGRDDKTITSLSDLFQPNYITTQMKAFLWGLDTLPDQINFAWISQLHLLATDKLQTEFADPIENRVRSYTSHLIFPSRINEMLTKCLYKCSMEGLESLSMEIVDDKDPETNGEVLFLLQDNIKALKNPYDNVGQFQVIDAKTVIKFYQRQLEMFAEAEPLLKELAKDLERNIAKMIATGAIFNSDLQDQTWIDKKQKAAYALIQKGYYLLLKEVGYVLLNKNPYHIRAKAERMIDKYNSAPKASELEKLNAIIDLVKGLLNLHVWPDGNGRLCAHQLLNLLLIKNGLTPTLLNNNCLDAFTKDELRARIIEGMRLFREKCIEKSNDDLLEKFRTEMRLEKLPFSDLGKAVIANDMTRFRDSLNQWPLSLTQFDLELISNSKTVDIQWFVEYFNHFGIITIDGKKCSLTDFLHILIPMVNKNANKPLLLNIIDYLQTSEHKPILVHHLLSLYTMCDDEIFEKIKSNINDLKKSENIIMIYYMIATARNESTALYLFEVFENELNRIKEDKLYVKDINIDHMEILNLVCKQQSVSVISKFFDLEYFDKQSNRLLDIDKLVQTIENRIDLSNEQKKEIINKIYPHYDYNPLNPLSDFHQHYFKLEP